MDSLNLLGKRIYLAPCNDLTIDLAINLKSAGVNILGFIDNYSDQPGVIRSDSNCYLPYDYILVLSPNHWLEILLQLPDPSFVLGVYSNFQSSESLCLMNCLSHNEIINEIRGNKKSLLHLKDKHKGKRVFLIGNGPSLKIKDLEKLENEITIGCNKLFLAYTETSWRPSYFTLVDQVHMESCHPFISNYTDSVCFYPYGAEGDFPFINHALHYFNLPSSRDGVRGFSLDIVEGIVGGNQVTYSMFQLLMYMGVNEIYLLGVDFNYIYPEEASGSQIISEGELNHFHKDYFSKGDLWTDPNLDSSLIDFDVIRKVADERGVAIYNATRGGNLEFFDRVDFDSLNFRR